MRDERGSTRGRILIVVQNLSVPTDRRVWQESLALVAAGFGVTVICPAAPGDPHIRTQEGVVVRTYRPVRGGSGVAGYVREFVGSWLKTAWLALRCARSEGFDVLQACNPPDTYWLLGLVCKALGKRFVFDHHDLCPEVYVSRFGRPSKLLLRGLLGLERATMAVADHVITTNESYRALEIERDHRDPTTITVVRSGPDLRRLRQRAPRPDLRNGRDHLVCYLGIMGPQDDVDVVVRAAAHVVHDLGREDVQFALLGFGDCLDELRALATELGVDPWVTFTGRADDDMICDYLSSADVGLAPDLPGPLNDVSTMNKTLEYMAFELPVLTFDLGETRVSAGPGARYVEDPSPAAFGEALVDLLDHDGERRLMGSAGRRRLVDGLSWESQRDRYVSVYRALLEPRRTADDVPIFGVPALGAPDPVA